MALTYYHVTPSGAGDKDGAGWATAMSLVEFKTSIEAALVDTVYFMAGGTYTFTMEINPSTRNGTAVAPIVVIGVKASTTNEGASIVFSDWARADADRPLFDCGATHYFMTGNYYHIHNISVQGAFSYVLNVGSSCIVENCKGNNNYASSSARFSIQAATYSTIINCEFTSTFCGGLKIASAGSRVLFSYFHDMTDATNGIAVANQGIASGLFAFNIFSNIKTIALSLTTSTGVTVLNNTFYGNAVDVSASTAFAFIGINNIHEATTANAYIWTTETDINFFANNHGSDARCHQMWSGVDTTTVFQDYAVSSGDPKFTTPGSNFSLQSTSPNINNGLSESLGVS
jgi:hypothetical protein